MAVIGHDRAKRMRPFGVRYARWVAARAAGRAGDLGGASPLSPAARAAHDAACRRIQAAADARVAEVYRVLGWDPATAPRIPLAFGRWEGLRGHADGDGKVG